VVILVVNEVATGAVTGVVRVAWAEVGVAKASAEAGVGVKAEGVTVESAVEVRQGGVGLEVEPRAGQESGRSAVRPLFE
jgi:hypothetical protein